MTESQTLDGFREAIRQAGFDPPDHIEADGELHRFSTNGKRGDKAGYYVLHLDGIPAGLFGCWRKGFSQKWRADIGRSLTPSENAELTARMAEQKAKRDAQAQADAKQAQQSCETVWSAANPRYQGHLYLVRKGIDDPGLGLKVIDSIDLAAQDMFWSGEGWLQGPLLLIPIFDGLGEMVSLQAIDNDGNKSFARKGRKRAGFHLFGTVDPTGPILVGEGLATVWAALKLIHWRGSGAVAFDAGNLDPAAKVLKMRFPAAQFIVLADVDENGRGEQEATKAAQSVRGRAWIPSFSPAQIKRGASDFWDLYRGLQHE